MIPTLAIDAADHVVGQLPHNGLESARATALAALRRKGVPGLRDEDWKYTDLAGIVELSNDWLRSGGITSQVDSAAVDTVAADFDVDWLVIRNGEVDTDSLRRLQQPGLDVALLSTVASPGTLETALSDMNLALLRDGIAIHVAAGAELSRPIGLLHFDDAGDSQSVSQARIVITQEAGSRACFLEYHVSRGDSAHFANTVIDLALADGAHAEFLRIQERHSLHSQTGYLRARLHAGSGFRHGAFDFGGKLVRNDLRIEINAPDAHAEFCGLYLATDRQHIDNHTRVDHRTGPATSAQEYRGILQGRSRCVWNGKAIVHAGADGTDASQANHNLLLSERCEIDTKPELEIYADDVKCSHGTTVGQLDETALFYLRTRGIDEPGARRMLTQAFAEAILAKAPLKDLHNKLSDRILTRLAQMSAGEQQ